MTSNEDLAKAIDRLARTADGHELYLFLQKTLCGVLTGARDDGALREHEGRRMFAAELMALMAKGIIESGGRDNPAVVFSRQHSGPVSGHVSARDYLRKQLADEPAGQ